MAGRLRLLCLSVLLISISSKSWSQVCTALGQNPNTAFPVCGATTFVQKTVPRCSSKEVPAKGCSNKTFPAVNPYWYKFTCYSAGTLGFVITPLSTVNEDYDWQLFDITGRDPMDIFTDPSLVLTANWAGTYGPTGASAAGTKVFECASNPAAGISAFAKMPDLIVGHEYLLLVSHFLLNTVSEIGYTLSFQGGTASIVNPVVPVIQNTYAVCDGTEIVVKLNKKIKCSNIDSDGSDFSISGPAPISIVSASGNGCNNGFDSDSILLKLNKILSPGTYTVTAKAGSDSNTLTDNCGNGLAPGANASLSFTPARPTPMDSISPVVCITDTIQLVFKNPMNCNSIAPDGSDFIITGPAPVTVKSASGICSNDVSTIIRIFLTAPVKTNGTFQIKLVTGSDGNTLINECGEITPAGSVISFTTQNITTADFQTIVNTGCKYDLLLVSHNGNNGANKWTWNIDDGRISTVQNPVFKYDVFGTRKINLTVTNGKCSDTASASAVLPDYTVKAAFFSSKDTLCPVDTLSFADISKSASSINRWIWNFGNGSSSILQSPPAQSYPVTPRQSTYIARLTVTNVHDCSDTAYKNITTLISCYIAVPSAFTPNGDGLNDYLYPLNAFKADQLVFRVYNRYGQVIFETRDWSKKWDGRVNGIPQGSGTYVWTLDYINKDTGKKVFLNGTTVLIR